MKKNYNSVFSALNDGEIRVLEKEVPEFQPSNVEAIHRKFDQKTSQKVLSPKVIMKKLVIAASIMVLFISGVNLNTSFAEKMYSIPIVGEFARLVTIKQLTYSSDIHDIDIEVPRIIGIDDEALQEKINEMLEEKSLTLYEEAIEVTEENQGRQAVNQNYSIKRNDDQLLVFSVVTTEIRGSAKETVDFYNIDVRENQLLEIKNVFMESYDYVPVINGEIIRQMHLDEKYYVEKFKGIDDDTNFYLNDVGNLVIVFDEYEVAAGCYGMPEIEIDSKIFGDEMHGYE